MVSSPNCWSLMKSSLAKLSASVSNLFPKESLFPSLFYPFPFLLSSLLLLLFIHPRLMPNTVLGLGKTNKNKI
jgi:hypothetical protein